ncbi:MAG: triose-phosphate isomerase [Deltaproteobacteria bacterium]|nr:triose-phosphate isomerase [Deltaproteobacteria bacterium]
MATPLIAGNWKMHMTINQAASLVLKIRDAIKGVHDVEVVVAPPFTALHHINYLLAETPIQLCGQDVFWEKNGAYTGELSPEMLKDVGCHYVIIGHSERRQHFHETDENVNKKLLASLKEGLKPILCVGESLEQRESGKAISIIRKQVAEGLKNVSHGHMKDVVVAYEPIWAIGTGKTAKPEQAEDIHNGIRELLYDMFNLEAVKETRLIYGGSVKANNIDDIMAQPNIDGVLVGGASLSAEEFARIVRFEKT